MPKPQPDGLERVLKQNEVYAARLQATNPQVFETMCEGQHPEYFWLGCADSRVPANAVTGLGPGELFVHRNVGNLVQHSDLNCMSALEYAVQELEVKHIIVCGHYGCGAVKAALALPSMTLSIVNCWISSIRDTRNNYSRELEQLQDPKLQHDRLCELNVARQCYSVCTSPVVQAAWARGQALAVHGVIYSLSDGILKPLVGPITCLAEAATPTPIPTLAPVPAPAPTPVTPPATSPTRAALNFSFVTPSLRPAIDAAVAAASASAPSSSPPSASPPSSFTPSDFTSDTASPRDTSPAPTPTPTHSPARAAAGKKVQGADVEEVNDSHMGGLRLAGLASDLKAALSLHARYDALAACSGGCTH